MLLTIFKNDEWYETVFDPFIIEQLVKDVFKIKLNQESSFNANKIEKMMRKRGFTAFDIFTSEAPMNLEPHYHVGEECRIFLEGSGKFFLRKDAFLYELTVCAGDSIILPSQLRHGFQTFGKILAVRLFTADGYGVF